MMFTDQPDANTIRQITQECGLHLLTYEKQSGGDINRSYCLHCREGKFFVKINSANKFPLMLEKEARGLNALRNTAALIVPHVIQYGVVNEQQYLILEWMEAGPPGEKFWENFGRGLALIHKNFHPSFGWNEDNYIGSLRQKNERHETWSAFYTHCRIMPLVNLLHGQGTYTLSEVNTFKEFCGKLDELFPKEPPSMVHGDLWSGNFLITKHGDASIFDPAVYYGNREMDIGMTKLFGGFDSRFYDAYHEAFPLQDGWQQRIRLTQLYALLVHAVLFGGQYIAAPLEIIKSH
jgi:fructosamine-3-kinase